jgi:hypothetical protein
MDGGGMNRLRFVQVAISVFALSGCGLSTNSHSGSPGAIQRSSHTLHELCNFPKQFFAAQFHAENLRVAVTSTKPLTEKIGTGNGCDYHTADSEYLGYIFLDAPPAVTSPAAAGTGSPRTLTVDGVAVTETPRPISRYLPSQPLRRRMSCSLRISTDGEVS